MSQFKSEIKDGMRIDWDAPIAMEDGVVLRADVFRPVKEGKYPVVMTYGVYGKWLAFQDGYGGQWKTMIEGFPEVAAGSTNKYQNWEVVDPEKWVPDGYVCLRIDSRGAGRSPGYLEPFSPRETQDLYQCIEWAAAQPWSNGKVGLNGISYYAMNQWHVACLKPPHLAAICAWEGGADYYRDFAYHGGIYSTYISNWYANRATTKQHGHGERGYKSRVNGEWVSGPETLSEEEIKVNRCDLGKDILSHPLFDEYWQARIPDWSKVTVPLLSASNWGGQGIHPRGNIEGFVRAASEQKWLEVHGREHWTEFYTDYGVNLQKKFFGHFLKSEDTGWKKQPKVLLQVRHPGEKFVERHESEWPLARTQWTRYYLNPGDQSLGPKPATATGAITYEGLGDGVTFLAPPLEKEIEITGPLAAKLFVSSETADADLFLIVRVFSPNMSELTFRGALDPRTPIAQGWLRASHRKLDQKLTLPYRPYHAHDEKQPLTPGEVYELDVEIWTTCIVLPPGYRLGLTVRGKDYMHPCGAAAGLAAMYSEFTGVGPFRHDDASTRPADVFGGKVTLHMSPDRQSHVLLPVIPSK
ncbi:MAG: CocE/NonD family hydrolase [Burkholderiales bacterium]|nr:CocE/NonD family hydrolase [Burkholderiales bacterium]